MLQMAMRSLLCACPVSREGGGVWGLIEMGILQSSHFFRSLHTMASVIFRLIFPSQASWIFHKLKRQDPRSWFLVYVCDGCVCVSCNAARLVALELSNMIVDPARIYHVGAGNCVA